MRTVLAGVVAALFAGSPALAQSQLLFLAGRQIEPGNLVHDGRLVPSSIEPDQDRLAGGEACAILQKALAKNARSAADRFHARSDLDMAGIVRLGEEGHGELDDHPAGVLAGGRARPQLLGEFDAPRLAVGCHGDVVDVAITVNIGKAHGVPRPECVTGPVGAIPRGSARGLTHVGSPSRTGGAECPGFKRRAAGILGTRRRDYWPYARKHVPFQEIT